MAKSPEAATPFEASLTRPAPPADWAAPLQALWQLEKGHWDAAHELVQHEAGADAAWVHAHLHRIEGDEWNAGYWYRRAGRPVGSCDLEVERRDIASEFLAAIAK